MELIVKVVAWLLELMRFVFRQYRDSPDFRRLVWSAISALWMIIRLVISK